ncbi:S1 family peptidase [Laspinema olomoucense]|uniref:S1 family peptidase n=1 Tax=Laspinema olomoucense TaxID=3231600 RepID=UPI0021BACCAC|nr:serine protease [Laspinema sp. D3c]MCT7997550.1 serine protease [Laspinema sp. D3c]
MYFRYWILYGSSCAFLLLQLQIQSCTHSGIARSLNAPVPVEVQPVLSNPQLCEIARSISVVILSVDGKSAGSGFVIHQKPDPETGRFLYKVITNAHVLTEASQYQIQTPDGIIHSAIALFRFGDAFSETDIAVLQFHSSNPNYSIARLSTGFTLSAENDRVVAAGFPIRTGERRESEFVCTEPGAVSFVLRSQSMQGGYNIGYLLDIRKGMSGGPLLNQRGEAIGVNGKHSRPPFGGNNLYRLENGEPVSESSELLRQSSWAIAMDRVVPLAISQGIALNYNIPASPRQITMPTELNLDSEPRFPLIQNPPESVSTDTQHLDSPSALDSSPSGISTQDEIAFVEDSISSSSPTPSTQETSNRQVSPPHPNSQSNSLPISSSFEISALEEIAQLAQHFTVRVFFGNAQRSGFIISKNQGARGYFYQVLTYEEINQGNFYQIQTFDGKIYSAIEKYKVMLPNGKRVVIVDFSSPEDLYPVATLSNDTSISVPAPVLISGYFEEPDLSKTWESFVITAGHIQVNCEGDEITRWGMSNPIDEGAIGGPILDARGQVIGIVTEQNNSRWSNTETGAENHYSWGIPIQVYLRFRVSDRSYTLFN